MGNLDSVLDVDRMNEITDEACELFLSKFPSYFEDQLFKEFISLNNDIKVMRSTQLEQPPKLQFPLKSGILYKRGAQIKNWKRRHFVALNEADNFDIVYYKIRKGNLYRRGSIPCNGYRVEMFADHEEDMYGPYGLKLVPNDDRKRCWWFKAEDEDDKREWEEIFSNACRRADPNRHHEPVIARAFDKALQSVRYSYGYFGPLDVLGTEEETLFDFIGGQILHRELLQDAFNSIRSGPDKISQIQEMQRLANRTVAVAVKHTWKKALDGALFLLPAFLSVDRKDKHLTAAERMEVQGLDKELRDARLRELFGLDFFKKFSAAVQVEAEIHSKICTALSSIVDPVIFDSASTVCVPLLEAILEPFNQAYAEAISGFRVDMQSQIEGGKLALRQNSRHSAGSHSSAHRVSDDACIVGLSDVLAAAHMRVNSGYNSGPLQAPRSILWDMYTSNLNQPEVLHCFLGKGLSAYDIYIRASDSVTELVHNAVYSLGELLRSEQNQWAADDGIFDAKDRNAVLHCLDRCVEMMSADAKILQHKVLVDIFQSLLDPVVQEMIVIPSADVVQQMRILVPVDLRCEFNIESCGERLVHEMVETVLNSLVTQFMSSSFGLDSIIVSHSAEEITIV